MLFRKSIADFSIPLSGPCSGSRHILNCMRSVPRLDDLNAETPAFARTLAAAGQYALDHVAVIAKVLWLSHANIATTRMYDHSKTRPEDSPTLECLLRER